MCYEIHQEEIEMLRFVYLALHLMTTQVGGLPVPMLVQMPFEIRVEPGVFDVPESFDLGQSDSWPADQATQILACTRRALYLMAALAQDGLIVHATCGYGEADSPPPFNRYRPAIRLNLAESDLWVLSREMLAASR